MKSFFLALLCIIFLYLSLNSAGDEAKKVEGVWLTGSKKAKVQIFERNGKFYGKIVWLREPKDKEGKDKMDKNNPDPKLRIKPLIGLENLTDFEYDGELEWDDGYIYDPENGKTYSCKMWLENDNTLNVRGYIGISLLGRTEVWLRDKL